MGASSKKSRNAASNKKSIFITAGIFVVFLLLGFWYYQSRRPNYRDLEKAYSELQIPADWTLENSSSNKGTLGLFCWQLEGEACPYLNNQYANKSVITDENQQKISQGLLGTKYNFVKVFNKESCKVTDGSCGYIYVNKNIQAVVSFKSKNENGQQKINISLSKKE